MVGRACRRGPPLRAAPLGIVQVSHRPGVRTIVVPFAPPSDQRIRRDTGLSAYDELWLSPRTRGWTQSETHRNAAEAPRDYESDQTRAGQKAGSGEWGSARIEAANELRPPGRWQIPNGGGDNAEKAEVQTHANKPDPPSLSKSQGRGTLEGEMPSKTESPGLAKSGSDPFTPKSPLGGTARFSVPAPSRRVALAADAIRLPGGARPPQGLSPDGHRRCEDGRTGRTRRSRCSLLASRRFR